MTTRLHSILGSVTTVASLVFLLASVISVPTNAISEEFLCKGAGGTPAGGECTFENQPELTGENSFVQTITDILLYVVGAAAVIMLIFYGLRFITSGSDPQAVVSARNGILYSLAGIVVAFLAYAAVNFVATQVAPGG